MSRHNRRQGYWRYYELARSMEARRLQETLIDVIEKNHCPLPARSKRGHPPVHSKAKLGFACLHMTASNDTYRETESLCTP